MDYPSKVLIVGGLLNLLAGIGTGMVMAQMRNTAPTVPRPLTLAHMAGYMQAPILFGLVLVVQLSDLRQGWESIAAWLFVVGSLMLILKDLLNWRQKVEDEFEKPRPIGYHLGSAQAVAQVVGITILIVGVSKGL